MAIFLAMTACVVLVIVVVRIGILRRELGQEREKSQEISIRSDSLNREVNQLYLDWLSYAGPDTSCIDCVEEVDLHGVPLDSNLRGLKNARFISGTIHFHSYGSNDYADVVWIDLETPVTAGEVALTIEGDRGRNSLVNYVKIIRNISFNEGIDTLIHMSFLESQKNLKAADFVGARLFVYSRFQFDNEIQINLNFEKGVSIQAQYSKFTASFDEPKSFLLPPPSY